MALAEAARPRSPLETLGSSLVDFLQGSPVNKDETLGAVKQVFEQWAGGMGADYRPDIGVGEGEGSVHRRAQAGNPRWTGRSWGPPPGWGGHARDHAAPQVDPDAEARRIARQVMGFAATEPLSEGAIRDRKRQLAKRHHPDRGGSAAKMAEINDAADILCASL